MEDLGDIGDFEKPVSEFNPQEVAEFIDSALEDGECDNEGLNYDGEECKFQDLATIKSPRYTAHAYINDAGPRYIVIEDNEGEDNASFVANSVEQLTEIFQTLVGGLQATYDAFSDDCIGGEINGVGY